MQEIIIKKLIPVLKFLDERCIYLDHYQGMYLSASLIIFSFFVSQFVNSKNKNKTKQNFQVN